MALDRAPRPGLALDRASVRSVDEKSGHLHVAVSPISKATVRPYYGREIPRSEEMGLAQDRVYNLYLDPEELARGAATFTGKPLLIQHRPQLASDHDRSKVIGAVGAANWADPYAQAPLTIWDGDGIEAVESGDMQELSAGFFYRADMTPGFVDGQAYDGVMRDIQGNHVALVEAGRAGPDVMVLDAKLKETPMPKPLSRKAAAVRSVLTDYLPTKLATDAALDIRALVAPVTAANWAQERPRIAKAIRAAKLAADAKLDDLDAALDEADDDEDEKKAAADERPDDEKPAHDEDDDDEKERAAAMDAAIRTASIRAAREAAASTRAAMHAMREAERAVAPFVGELTVAMDSAADVYKFAFGELGVDVAGVHESAFPAILKAHAKAVAPRSSMAQDAGPPKDFDSRWARPAGAPLLKLV